MRRYSLARRSVKQAARLTRVFSKSLPTAVNRQNQDSQDYRIYGIVVTLSTIYSILIILKS